MKNGLLLLLLAFAINVNGQNDGKWSTGIGYSPSIQGGATFAIYLNRHVGKKWQVGLIPFGWLDSYTSVTGTSSKSNSLGLNLTSRFMPVQFNVFRPYLYAFSGFGHSTFKRTNPSYSIQVSTDDYFNYSVGIGVETIITSGWSIDTNLGYLRLEFLNDGGYYNTPVFSVGVLKRFGKVKESTINSAGSLQPPHPNLY